MNYAGVLLVAGLWIIAVGLILRAVQEIRESWGQAEDELTCSCLKRLHKEE